MKRIFDFSVALLGLLGLFPLLSLVSFLIWLTDFHSPFYRGSRLGRKAIQFRMMKFRSMIVDADRTGVTSTSVTDNRITLIGRWIRRFKVDELPQLWNVLLGEMSFVGPRPQVPQALERYSSSDRQILELRPGITDFSSIIFSDEGDILKDERDADEGYYRLIHPWKMQLSHFYLKHQSVSLDIFLIAMTILCILSRKRALRMLSQRIAELGGDPVLVRLSLREEELSFLSQSPMTAKPM